MDKNLNPGDVVELKSGGPLMTIRYIEKEVAFCDWFTGAEARNSRFSLVQLKKTSSN